MAHVPYFAQHLCQRGSILLPLFRNYPAIPSCTFFHLRALWVLTGGKKKSDLAIIRFWDSSKFGNCIDKLNNIRSISDWLFKWGFTFDLGMWIQSTIQTFSLWYLLWMNQSADIHVNKFVFLKFWLFGFFQNKLNNSVDLLIRWA